MYQKIKMTIICMASVVLILANDAYAKPIPKNELVQIIDSISEALSENYIYPEKVQRIESELKKRIKSSNYLDSDSKESLARQLTKDIYELTGDLHFHVRHDSEAASLLINKQSKEEIKAKDRSFAEQDNYGFREVKILEGNVGYIKFDTFHDPGYAADRLSNVMEFVSGVDGLIIDLRDNNGGVLEFAQLFNSYFFEYDDDTVFFDYYFNEKGKRIERKQWVLPSVNGKRMLDTPLYILTSSVSFSSAEWMAYSLKNLERAKIVGEVTAGGAHPVSAFAINQHFVINIPIGEITNPAAGSGDFEGKGVSPDINVAAGKALATAHKAVLGEIFSRDATNDSLTWFTPVIESRLERVSLSEEVLKEFVGEYQGKFILYEEGTLFYSWNGKNKVPLRPLNQTLFELSGVSDFRIQIIRESGKVMGFKRVYRDGQELIFLRDKA